MSGALRSDQIRDEADLVIVDTQDNGQLAPTTRRCLAIPRVSYDLKAEKSFVRLSLASPKSITHFGL